MFTFKRTLSILSMAALFLVACTPEDGDTGPAGPVGPEGPIGPAGAGDPGVDGTDGTDGKDGVANITVQTYVVPSLSWSGAAVKEYKLAIPEINQAVVDNGTVQVFQTETPTNPTWQALPFNYVIGLNSQSGVVTAQINMQYGYKSDSLNLTLNNSLGANITGSATFPGDRTVKVVIIPPSSKIAGFEPKTYEELQMVYGLTD